MEKGRARKRGSQERCKKIVITEGDRHQDGGRCCDTQDRSRGRIVCEEGGEKQNHSKKI